MTNECNQQPYLTYKDAVKWRGKTGVKGHIYCDITQRCARSRSSHHQNCANAEKQLSLDSLQASTLNHANQDHNDRDHQQGVD